MERHFILTHGRSGSNFLANSLNHHPSLVNYGEVLGEWTLPYKLFQVYRRSGRGWSEFLDTLYSSKSLFYAAQGVSCLSHLGTRRKARFKRRSAIKSLGLKDFAFLIDKRGLEDYLCSRQDIKVIYLTRRNHFNRYLSLLNLRKSGVVKTEVGSPVEMRYVIDIADLLESVRVFRQEEEFGDRLVGQLAESRVFAMDYDQYFASAEATSKTHSELFGFLGVEDLRVTSSQKKILASDPREHVENYKDVAVALEQAGYAAYLN